MFYGPARWRFRQFALKHLPKTPYRAIKVGSANSLRRHLIEEANYQEIWGPRFFGTAPPDHDGDRKIQLLCPKLEVTELRDVILMGGADLWFSKKNVYHPDFYNPRTEVIPAETFGILKTSQDFGTLRAFTFNNQVIDEAITLTAQCEGNYAHFLVEVLPKLAVINKTGLYDGVPLIVGGWMHENILKSLYVLNRRKRKIILIDRWQTTHVRKLITVSPPAYITAEFRDHATTGSLDGFYNERFPFSRMALHQLRASMLEALPHHAKGRPPANKKFFIRRNMTGNGRRALNALEAEATAVKMGFRVIDPGTMTFKHQVSTFQHAEVIAGQIGAAMANTIFSKEGCRVVGLSPWYPKANYHFWSNFMGALGHDLKYVIGPQTETTVVTGKTHTLHRDFEIDIPTFKLALEEACGR